VKPRADTIDEYTVRIEQFTEVVGRCDEILDLLEALRDLTYGGDVLEAREAIRRLRSEADRGVTLWEYQRRHA